MWIWARELTHNQPMDLLIDKIINTDGIEDDELLTQSGRIYTFLNPVSYLDAARNQELFQSIDGIFADGSLLVSAIRFLYAKKVKRRSFDMTSLAPKLFRYAQEKDKSIYIVASRDEQVKTAVKRISDSYNGIKIVGFRNGYFNSDQEIKDTIRRIISVKPNYLIVGMGAIKQEQFLVATKAAGFDGIGFTCGGFIHQVANNEMNYYPNWINKMNIRFLYRMWKEKHTRKRYLITPPQFVWQIVRGRFSKNPQSEYTQHI